MRSPKIQETMLIERIPGQELQLSSQVTELHNSSPYVCLGTSATAEP